MAALVGEHSRPRPLLRGPAGRLRSDQPLLRRSHRQSAPEDPALVQRPIHFSLVIASLRFESGPKLYPDHCSLILRQRRKTRLAAFVVVGGVAVGCATCSEAFIQTVDLPEVFFSQQCVQAKGINYSLIYTSVNAALQICQIIGAFTLMVVYRSKFDQVTQNDALSRMGAQGPKKMPESDGRQ